MNPIHILATYLCKLHLISLPTQGFQVMFSYYYNKILHVFLVAPLRATCSAHPIFHDLITQIIFGEH